MITKEKAIIEAKRILNNEIKLFYRKSNLGRPNVLTLEQVIDAIFLCSS